jgi:hypothetical protein
MKALCFAFGLVLPCVDLSAQGTVNFANDTTCVLSNVVTGARVVAGAAFSAGLYYLPATNSSPAPSNYDFDTRGVPLLPSTGLYYGGLFEGGVRTTPSTTSPGGPAWVQVRVWETAFGTSYEQAVAAPALAGRRALAGTSNIIRVQTGNPAVTLAAPASLACSGLGGVTLTPVDGQIPIGDFRTDSVIVFNSQLGHTYAVDKTTNLNPVVWFPLPGATNIAGTGAPVSVSDAGSGCLDQRYYRIRLVQ